MKSISRRLAVLAAAVGSILGANSSFADTDTDNLLVSASVTATCTISTAPVAFGAYDPTNAEDLDGAGSVTVLCTNGTAGYITLGQGAHFADGSSADAPLRRMAGGAAGAGLLNYQLFSDAAREVVWGDSETTGVDHVGTGNSATIAVYGRIPALQNVIAGSGVTAYADTVVATVEF